MQRCQCEGQIRSQTKQDSGPLDRWEAYAHLTQFQKLYSVMTKDLLNASVQDTKQEIEHLHLFYESTFRK